MSFIEYNPGKGGLRPGSVKFTKTHLIISPDLQEKLDAPSILVSYDPDIETLKLKPVESGGLKMTDGKLQSKGFCGYFGISKRGVYKTEWNDKEKALYVPLKNKQEGAK